MARRELRIAVLHLILSHQIITVQCQWHYKRLSGHVLGHVFEERLAHSAITCCMSCSRVYRCVAVNFWPGDGRCELNRRSPKKPNSTGLVLNPGPEADVYYADACDEPWKQYLGGCYLFSGTQRNWTASRDFCRSRAAELVDIHSDQENAFVRDTVVEGLHPMWLGLPYYNTLGNREWTTGRPFTYSHFAEGQPFNDRKPNGVGDDDCIAMEPEFGYIWADCACSGEFVCTCEKLLY